MDENRISERKAQTGDRRFACQCGAHYFDGQIALAHTVMGHETVLETYRHGKWYYHPQPVSDYLIEMLEPRLGGEGMELYVSRIEKMAEEADRNMKRIKANEAV